MNFKFPARGLTAALAAMLVIGGLCGRARADTPISACGPLALAGNYFLTSNLTATGDCIVIAASNVGIDLKGKTITGNGTGSGITDDGTARNYAIIENGTIRNFNRGINLFTSGAAIISNIDSSKNTADGIFIKDCCNTLSFVRTDNNGGAGIFIDSEGSNLATIETKGNGSGGILITSQSNTLVGSAVFNNTGVGVEMDGGESFVINSNIVKNSADGLLMTNCCNGVLNSASSGNGGDGMDFPTSGDNMISASKANGNAATGINLLRKWGIISGVQANRNDTGVAMACRGSTASLTAQKNRTKNLNQMLPSDGPCANVNLKAP